MHTEKLSGSLVTAAVTLMLSTAAFAQTAVTPSPAPPAPAGLAAALAEPTVTQDNVSPDANSERSDWSALTQPTLLWPDATPVPQRGGTTAAAPSTIWNRNERSDGSAAVTLGTQLPTEWDTRVGMDVGLRGDATAAPWPATPNLPGAQPWRDNSGAAWANLSTPRTLGLGAAFETRVDPVQEQGKLATTFSQTTPLGGDFALTLQNGYAMTQSIPGAGPAAPSIGATAQSALTVPSQVWSTERLARFNVLATGTSFAVGAKTSTTETGWERSLSAEQRLSDHLSVTGAVTETPTGELSKSLKGGFKFSW